MNVLEKFVMQLDLALTDFSKYFSMATNIMYLVPDTLKIRVKYILGM